jgi:hypothetical protein
MPDSLAELTPLRAPARTPAALRRLEATRYLAAAAHSDPEFRKSVLDQIERQEYRCRAPEFGIDEGIVVEECRRADRRRKIREALLLAVLLLFLLLSRFMSDLSDGLDDFGLLLRMHSKELILVLVAGAVLIFGEALLQEHFTLRRRFAKPA